MKNIKIQMIESSQIKNNIPNIRSGDEVSIKNWIKEGETKKRIQIFKGFIIAIKNRGINSSFTVRKISYGIGVEKVFKIHSPIIKDIKIEKRAKVRRSKLYYMRTRKGKSSRIKKKI